MVLIVLAMLIGLVAFLLIRYVPPAVATPASRRPGSVHFTIPVLSPFTSVVSAASCVCRPQYSNAIALDRTRDIRGQCSTRCNSTTCSWNHPLRVAEVLYDAQMT